MSLNRFYPLQLSLCVLLLIPAMAVAQAWTSLSPTQKEALAPLAAEWDTLQTEQRRRLVNLAKHYPKLNAAHKQRMHHRLNEWSKLTPRQRERAREKFQAFSKIPSETRNQVKEMIRQQEAAKSRVVLTEAEWKYFLSIFQENILPINKPGSTTKLINSPIQILWRAAPELKNTWLVIWNPSCLLDQLFNLSIAASISCYEIVAKSQFLRKHYRTSPFVFSLIHNPTSLKRLSAQGENGVLRFSPILAKTPKDRL